MKLRYVLIGLLAIFLVFAFANRALAPEPYPVKGWSAITSGYAVTTQWQGLDVPVGESVTATAGTTDPEVEWIRFVWHFPDDYVYDPGGVARDTGWLPVIPVAPDWLVTPDDLPPAPIPQSIINWANENPNTEYRYQQDAFIPYDAVRDRGVLGDWGVQAIFHDITVDLGVRDDLVRIRATSFNVVPEVPFGTITILLSWCGILGVFALRRKHLLR